MSSEKNYNAGANICPPNQEAGAVGLRQGMLHQISFAQLHILRNYQVCLMSRSLLTRPVVNHRESANSNLQDARSFCLFPAGFLSRSTLFNEPTRIIQWRFHFIRQRLTATCSESIVAVIIIGLRAECGEYSIIDFGNSQLAICFIDLSRLLNKYLPYPGEAPSHEDRSSDLHSSLRN
jgi:hypothetical protein